MKTEIYDLGFFIAFVIACFYWHLDDKAIYTISLALQLQDVIGVMCVRCWGRVDHLRKEMQR